MDAVCVKTPWSAKTHFNTIDGFYATEKLTGETLFQSVESVKKLKVL